MAGVIVHHATPVSGYRHFGFHAVNDGVSASPPLAFGVVSTMSGGALARRLVEEYPDERGVRVARREQRERVHEAAGRLSVGGEVDVRRVSPYEQRCGGRVCARMYCAARSTCRPAVTAQSLVAHLE